MTIPRGAARPRLLASSVSIFFISIPSQPREALGGADAAGAIRERRDVWIAEEERRVSCPVYERDGLTPGHRFSGPAIVEQMDATTLVLPGMTARVDAYLNLILEAA